MRIEEKCANLEVDLRGKMFEVLDTMLETTYRVSLTTHLCLPLANDELYIQNFIETTSFLCTYGPP